MSRTTKGTEIIFGTVKSFSKQKGMRKMQGYIPVGYIDEHLSPHIVNEAGLDVDFIPAMLLHSEYRDVLMDESREVKALELDMERYVIRIAEILETVTDIDLIVVSVYNTVLVYVGNRMQYTSMFTIEGHIKKG